MDVFKGGRSITDFENPCGMSFNLPHVGRPKHPFPYGWTEISVTLQLSIAKIYSSYHPRVISNTGSYLVFQSRFINVLAVN
jgi:hypothetical protein